MAKLLSGKVGVQTYAGLSTSRNQIVGGQQSFIGLSEVEPNLGLSPQNSYVLYGDANGTRRWGAPSGAPSGTVDGISIRDEGIQPVGLAGSVTILDIVGDGIVAIQTHITQGGVQVGLATLTVNKGDLEAQSGSGFVEVTGISTIRVGAGLTIFAPAGTTGIASIGNITDANIDIYDDRSYLSIPNVAQLQAGVGLSVTAPATNRVKFDVTGNIPRLNVSGITTLTQVGATDLNASGIITATTFDGNLEGNVTGNVTGDVNGNITGNVTGNVTGDVYAGLVTATRGINGNINSTGISTITQLLVSTINNTGFGTALGFISNGNSFMGNLNSGGISTTKYLQTTNINASGIITATSFTGDGSNLSNTGSTLSEPTSGSHRIVTTSLTSGTMTTSGTDSVLAFNYATHTLSSTNFAGNLTGNVSGNITGNVTGDLTGDFLAGLSTVTNELHIKSDDGTPGRINYYCESSNSHYVQVKSPPHSEYSGNISAVLPKKSGDFIVGDTVGAIDQNIHTSGIITATSFSGNGANLSNVTASSVLVTATNTTNATHYVAFSDSVSGQETMRSDIALTFNPSTDTLSCTTFNGNLSGNATGISGSPDITVNDITCHNILPAAHNTYSLGSNAVRFANVYCSDLFANDLNLTNKERGGNDVDGTWGDWTLQEGEEDIFLLNNRTGGKFRIALTPV